MSVVIPCYNVQEYIGACLHAVFEQSYQDIEVICVDDGSSDRTVDIIGQIANDHPIKLIQGKNGGACVARNKGIQASQGEWIQFLDADDILLPEKIAAQVEFVKRSSEAIDVVIGDYLNIYVGRKEVPVEALNGQDWMALIKTRMGTTSANLWKRSNVLTVGILV